MEGLVYKNSQLLLHWAIDTPELSSRHMAMSFVQTENENRALHKPYYKDIAKRRTPSACTRSKLCSRARAAVSYKGNSFSGARPQMPKRK